MFSYPVVPFPDNPENTSGSLPSHGRIADGFASNGLTL